MEVDVPPSQDCVRFILNGRPVSLHRPPPTRTLLEYLREDAGLTGTKEGCAEGDCGACTVVLGRRGDTGPRWQAINSCLRFVPTIDGHEVVTVEGLSAPSEPLHPVQQALVDCHASQCGFCTPGFVMSLFALYLSQPGASRGEVVDALAGNLCRCTGYRPIIDAGLTMFALPEGLRWRRAEAGNVAADERLGALRRSDSTALRYDGFHAPRTLDDLGTAFAAAPDSLLLAGGTDVGLWVTQQLRDLPPLIHLGEVRELQAIRRTDDGGLWIGAAVTATEAWPALVAACPALAEQAARFASPPVRNSATLCGNLANGSPIGDSLPVLLALDATLELRHGANVRALPLREFYLEYQKNALRRGELVQAVRVPPVPVGALVASYKIAKRIDQDISAVAATFLVVLDGDRVATARLAFGGMAGTARRAAAAEQALTGRVFDETSVAAAASALEVDFSPLGDHRASAVYRLQAAAGLLRRFALEARATAPLHLTADGAVLA